MLGLRQRGQSVMEFAITLPVLSAMLMGIADAGFIISNKAVAAQEVRNAVRIASLMPGAEDPPSGSTDGYDLEVSRTVYRALVGVGQTRSGLRAIDASRFYVFIYEPGADGQFAPALPGAVYIGGDNHIGGTFTSCDGKATKFFGGRENYPIASRHRATPAETPIAVQVQWEYRPVFIEAVTMHFCEYATQLMEPRA